ncbi:MAG TPA: heavy metal translocating P-type ATPase metal-binding domain-containing protein [Chitinophagaceae bacterium]|nr:heavy metal translocating P-type ATPase metal-binding domain-containing protein [Chitinophagaceae bacterium]HND96362.1 heavy metal translocating P-type ATPase metal-binding domain-containing protein [Chitinophagaceae bacterium]HNF45757.1 heavy metal translocating P-type ATPase metal-binding domain-containing protein [Chitinophagaceae bacterium]HNJ26650.1 heavy metal translocating P-type ATPase metal-binding domain-containing protein [Chitinophagaceae bacterium]HNJ55647.1 heavy metal transloc
MNSIKETSHKTYCYHCGESCFTNNISVEEKFFCCEGCKTVYQILNESNLCEYYNLNDNPGISQRIKIRKDKFAFLDDEKTQLQLISFRDENQVHVSFYLPQMHCSSCLYLLENLYRINHGVVSSKVNFTRKEVDVVFLSEKTSLRQVVETLTRIGYEPYISLSDLKNKRPAIDKSMVYQLGIAGFCFGNIMMLSFPEYLGIDASETGLRTTFRWISFALAIPVLLYAALPFYTSSWKSLKHKFLNIDAPIALAIIITFIRSAWEVISGTGGGYFDSMSGIVFFMLAGRILQDKTYRQLSFERDYTSYFPIAVSLLKDEKEIPVSLPEIKPGDTMVIHNEELIPADGILTRGKAFIDYSFVTGESLPVLKEVGELVYAGGKQTGEQVEILVIKEVGQSYLTKLWNKEEMQHDATEKKVSFVHLLSRYFTYIVFSIALLTAIYWQMYNPEKIWPAVTAIFIIACPCALLLSNTFTNGNVLRILGHNRFYLRSASVIEAIAATTHIVFDKTGTLTSSYFQNINYNGCPLTKKQEQQIAALAANSNHPLSRALAMHLSPVNLRKVSGFKEVPGEGIEGIVDDDLIKLGTETFVTGSQQASPSNTVVYVGFEGQTPGYFSFGNLYRDEMPALIHKLKSGYKLSVLSGDNEASMQQLQRLMGKNTTLLFHQKPEDKLNYIKHLQQSGESVMMIGDGLNDAGALKQSDVGIAVTEQANNFTPSSDAIIEAGQLPRLTKFFKLCSANKNIVVASFVLSIVYNVVGLFFAVQGNLSPLVAAILMPSSSLSILLLTFGSSSLIAKKMGLLSVKKT